MNPQAEKKWPRYPKNGKDKPHFHETVGDGDTVSDEIMHS
jgi:hypothetical protein